MNLASALALLLPLAALPPGQFEDFKSPSGAFIAHAGVAGPDGVPSARLRLQLKVEEPRSGNERDFSPQIDKDDWALTWAPHDVLLLCGRTHLTDEARPGPAMAVIAIEFHPLEHRPYSSPEVVFRKATAEETHLAAEAYRQKYGRDFKSS